jgi:hypothetical protein
MPNRKKGRPNWSPLLLTERSKFSTPIAKMLMGDAAGCARSIRLHVDVVGVARDVIGGERTGSAIDYFNSAIWSGRCFPQTPGFRLVRPFVRCRLVPERLCCRFERPAVAAVPYNVWKRPAPRDRNLSAITAGRKPSFMSVAAYA